MGLSQNDFEIGTAPVYLDASALAKLHIREPESEMLGRAVRGHTRLYASDLAVTEVVSALARRRREGSFPAEALHRAYRAILARFEDGGLHKVELVAEVHREAERLLLIPEARLRAADALHLALALSVNARRLVTYDVRLAAAAGRIGLTVWPES